MGTGRSFIVWQRVVPLVGVTCLLILGLATTTLRGPPSDAAPAPLPKTRPPAEATPPVEAKATPSLEKATLETISFQSVNFPTKHMLVVDDAIMLEEAAGRTPIQARLAATFRVVPWGGGAALESCARPGHFVVVRREGADAHVLKLDSGVAVQYAEHFEFRSLSKTFVRWRTRDGEKLYARHQFSMLKLHPKEKNPLFTADSSWITTRGLSACDDEARERGRAEQQKVLEDRARENAQAAWNSMLDPGRGAHDVTARVFLDISIGEPGAAKTHRMVIGLYGNVVPKTAYNFYRLCTGEAGSAPNGAALHYKGVKFHRVIPGFMAQGGDISRGKGGSGDSVFGGHFEDENFEMKHATTGTLSMANYGKDTNLSQFFISFVPLGHLDGKHVVFGEILEGLQTLRLMEAVGSRSGGTSAPIVISDAGALCSRDGVRPPCEASTK